MKSGRERPASSQIPWTILATSMKYKVEITRAAENELEKAYCFISNDSPVNAVRWREKFYELTRALSRFPKRCGLALENEFLNFEVRQQLHGSYRILFTINGQRVIVLHVRHAARRRVSADTITAPAD